MDPKSERILNTVHWKLARVIRAAFASGEVNFIVTEGLRTLARQKELVAAGASRTLNSKHLSGRAVDLAVLVGDEVRWDWPLYSRLAKVVKAAAASYRIRIKWGGDWPRFRDGPHFELSEEE